MQQQHSARLRREVRRLARMEAGRTSGALYAVRSGRPGGGTAAGNWLGYGLVGVTQIAEFRVAHGTRSSSS